MSPLITLFLLALAVACVSWTVTKEFIFEDIRKYCERRCSATAASVVRRKLFYIPTCEYCFSHYVTAALIAVTRFKLGFTGWWVDYPITGFVLVLIANVYMSLYFRLRLSIKNKGIDAKIGEALLRDYI